MFRAPRPIVHEHIFFNKSFSNFSKLLLYNLATKIYFLKTKLSAASAAPTCERVFFGLRARLPKTHWKINCMFVKVQSITKKHIPPVFQRFVFHVYLRNRLRYNKSIFIFLHPFLKSFQLEQEFIKSGNKIS